MEENLKLVLTQLQELENCLDSSDPAEAIRLQWLEPAHTPLHTLHFRPSETCQQALAVYSANDVLLNAT